MAVVAVCVLVPLAFSVFEVATHRPPPASAAPSHTPTPTPTHRTNSTTGSGLVLEVVPAPYQLPSALSREVALPSGSGVLLAGGLTAQDTSTDSVTGLNPVTGATRPVALLAAATHDAAGVILGGRAFLFGGGTAASVPTVQAIAPGIASATGIQAAVVGQLPTARSDASAVTSGSVAYVIGGYDGASWSPRVLATVDGRHFRVAARLRVPVRYAAVAAAGGQI
jgi:hypothetical protein